MTVALSGVSLRAGAETWIAPLDLELSDGSLNVLLGRTGAGKTSLLRLLGGLDRPTAGRVLVDGSDVTGMAVRRRSVAMVYQQFINYPSFTVYDNIASPLRRAGVDAATRDRRVREAAAQLRIDHLLRRLPGELSGGQQQRVAIARALVKQADLLLLDEPLVNLDYKLREELRAELRLLFEQRRATVVYATTEPHEALLIGGRVLVLDEGRLLQAGPTIEVFRNPASVRVGQVFSDPPMNLLPGELAGGVLALAGLRLAAPAHMAGLADGPYRFGIRSHHLSLARGAADDLALDLTVELAEISGSETFVHGRAAGVPLVVQEEGVHQLGLGQALPVFASASRLFVFDSADRLAASPDGPAAVRAVA